MPSSKGKEKEKEKGISIKEGASQAKQAIASKDASQFKQDGKRKVGEPVKGLPITQQRTSSKGAVTSSKGAVTEVQTNDSL